ncbi:MAG TPA: hypothetical protein VIK30_10265 [Polyangia bacterium]
MAGASRLVAALTVALAAAPVTDGAMRTEVDHLVLALAAARHLPFRGTLAARTVTREAAEREIAIAIGVGVASASGEVDGEILKRLGLIPVGADTGVLLAKIHAPSASLGAHYDLDSARLSVPDFIPLENQRVTLIHEIAHAIADQHFGLRDFLKMAPDTASGGARRLDGDAQRARLAIVEGDATLSGLELGDPHEGFLGTHARAALAGRLRDATTLGVAPLWFGELASFTHVDGFLFVARARAAGPWSAVDALWADPPASTEQVLHPEKYDACEPPVAVDEATLPSLPGFGRPAGSDVLGELVARTWLASVLPPEIAARAAAGWGGDRAGIYTAKPDASPDAGAASATLRPLAWLTVWDDAGEAEDFARAAAQVIAAQVLTPQAGVTALDRRGETVALLFGAPAPAAPALDEMLDGWRRRQTASRRSAPRPRHGAPPGCRRRDRAAGRE